MRRSMLVVLALVGMLLALSAAPTLATVHPLVCSELSADAANGTPADTQDPPGLTPGGPDQSRATPAQPVTVANSNAFKAPGCP